MKTFVYLVDRSVKWPDWFVEAWIVFMLACVVALIAIAINCIVDG